jgi:hypothetical protein
LGRIIHLDSAGKERNQLTRAIVLALGKRSEAGLSHEKQRDLAAFICLSLLAISETIEPSVAAWEKRGYWVKADRFRMEWLWTRDLAQRLRQALVAEEWNSIEQILIQVGKKFSGVKVSPRNRIGQPWIGAWQELLLG